VKSFLWGHSNKSCKWGAVSRRVSEVILTTEISWWALQQEFNKKIRFSNERHFVLHLSHYFSLEQGSTDVYVCRPTPQIFYDSKAEENKNIFTNKHTLIFQNNIHWYMYKYFEMNNIWTLFSLLLLTLNVPLHIGKCVHRDTSWPTQGRPLADWIDCFQTDPALRLLTYANLYFLLNLLI